MNNITIARNLLAALNERDVAKIKELCLDDCQLYFPRPDAQQHFKGNEIEKFLDWFNTELPQNTIARINEVANQDQAVIEFEVTGQSRHGHEYENIGSLTLKMEDNKIRDIRVYLDTADLQRVLTPKVEEFSLN